MGIGIKIKDLRLKNNLTQEELGDRCELTKGYISQLENDLTSPSIATLKDILIALGSNLADFFNDNEEESIVFSKADYFEKVTTDNTITWLVPTSQKNSMEPIIMTIELGGKTTNDLPHEGEEFGYLMEGRVKLILGNREFIVETGETFYFRASKSHYLENIGTIRAKILWVSCPPNF